VLKVTAVKNSVAKVVEHILVQDLFIVATQMMCDRALMKRSEDSFTKTNHEEGDGSKPGEDRDDTCIC
jgi:hypothetical protein